MQVCKWGNSLAVRLPAKLVEELGLKEGDEINIVRATKEELEVERKPTVDELFERIRQIPNKIPAGYRFKREDAYPPHRGGSEDDGDWE
jgi:antitoxin MazE